MPKAARQTDLVKHVAPHCHANHTPHPPFPFQITSMVSPNVYINGLPAAKMQSMTVPCTLPGCIPGGPGFVSKASATVMINGVGAARQQDIVTWPGCTCPTGKIFGPCSPNVDIGG